MGAGNAAGSGFEGRGPQASSLKPQAPNLKPQTSNLKPGSRTTYHSLLGPCDELGDAVSYQAGAPDVHMRSTRQSLQRDVETRIQSGFREQLA